MATGTSGQNVSGNQFVFPNKKDITDPRNIEALERWLNMQVVNQVIAGTNITITALPVQGGSKKTNGLVTINSSGGTSYVSGSAWGGYVTTTAASPTPLTGSNVVSCVVMSPPQYQNPSGVSGFPFFFEMTTQQPFVMYGQGEESHIVTLASGDSVAFQQGGWTISQAVNFVSGVNISGFVIRPFVLSIDGTQCLWADFSTPGSFVRQLSTVGSGTYSMPATGSSNWHTIGTDLAVVTSGGIGTVTYTGATTSFLVGEIIIAAGSGESS